MSYSQERINLAIASFESDACAYEDLAITFDKSDPIRAAACREMSSIIREWKNNPESIVRRIRSKGF